MLRPLFHEPPRKDSGLVLEANQAIEAYIRVLQKVPESQRTKQTRRIRIWSESFQRSLDELEQSEYAARQYGNKVKKRYIDELSVEERNDYHRHIYFYKNALIRVFSILDKLGYFLNEALGLKTERMKVRFSYFTVLRNMHQSKQHMRLEEQLFVLKNKYKEPLSKLRNERNMEIHTINADLLDDLLQAAEDRLGSRARPETDDVRDNLSTLSGCCEMVYTSAAIIFRYLARS